MQLLQGCALSTQVIDSFDIDKVLVRIFREKSATGNGAHSDYCRLAGRTINDWLACHENIEEFLRTMQKSNWIIRGEPAVNSRFWNLLQGNPAEMFGVFSAYELQVIYDWIRAGCSSDGRPYTEDHGQTLGQAVPSFRASSRLDAVRGVSLLQTPLQSAGQQLPDLDLQMLIEQFLHLDSDGE